MMRQQVQTERLYGLDWLRIGAFALLIFYHIGMYFVPWDWHVKTSHPLEWIELPMMALNPWRLSLLFLISGIGSRILLHKMAGAASFAAARSARLLIPVAAGMALFVAPQPWAELRMMAAYPGSFWQFWTSDYFRFGELHGIALPTWNHLWFVVYLWLYSTMLALLSCAPVTVKARVQQAFDRCFAGPRLLVVPIVYLAAARLILFPAFGETHALVDDPYAHSVYAFAFFFGVGLAASSPVWESVARWWKASLKMAIAAFTVIAVGNLAIAGEPAAAELALLRICRSVQAWAAIVGLIGFARLHLHYDGPVRRYLTEAIFPYYIAHQTIIVLAGFALAPLGFGAGTEFAIILAATVIGCALTYEAGRRIHFLRPLIGLKPAVRQKAAAAARIENRSPVGSG